MKFYVLALLVTASFAQASSTQDPLFTLMQGNWTGHGTRLHAGSAQPSQIDATVNSVVSVVDGHERLTSDNQLTETGAQAPAPYRSLYWIESNPNEIGGYSMGTGTQVTSTGSFTSQSGFSTFVSDQNLGSGYSVHSETVFKDGEADYTEVFTFNGQTVMTTQIPYQRTAQ